MRKFETIVRFATVDLVKAGWMLKGKGHWTITDAGVKALEEYPSPEAFYLAAIKLYHQWRAAQKGEPVLPEAPTTEADGIDDEAEKATGVTYEQADEEAWNQIVSHVQAMPPYVFQDLVAGLLKAMGYYVSWIAPPGKDGGTDIVAWSDPLGMRPPRIKVQVKRQQASISVDGLRAFMAVLGDDDSGIFVSVGGFTKDAKDEARTQERRRVTLIDLERLLELWVEHWDKLDFSTRQKLPLKPVWFLAPQE